MRHKEKERERETEINAVILQCWHMLLLFSSTLECVPRETFAKLSSMRNAMLVNVCRSLSCSLAGVSHGREDAPGRVELKLQLDEHQ